MEARAEYWLQFMSENKWYYSYSLFKPFRADDQIVAINHWLNRWIFSLAPSGHTNPSSPERTKHKYPYTKRMVYKVS